MSQKYPPDIAGLNPITDASESVGIGPLALHNYITGIPPFCSRNIFVLYNAWAVDVNGVPATDWEIGFGKYFHEERIITREQVIASSATSNGGNIGTVGTLVNFSAGTKFVTVIIQDSGDGIL